MDELLYTMARKIHERHIWSEKEDACRVCQQRDINGEFVFPCDAARLASVIVMIYTENT